MNIKLIKELAMDYEMHERIAKSIPSEPYTYRNNPHEDIAYHNRRMEEILNQLKEEAHKL